MDSFKYPAKLAMASLPRRVLLTLHGCARTSNGKASMLPADFYAQWRARSGITPTLREDHQTSPPERLLQAVWQHQRLRRDQLEALDGQTVRVLHPGFKNHEAGPDFRGAVIQVGAEPPHSGDVEVDVHSSGWRDHGHNRNPAFQNVILHVVWESERRAFGVPPLGGSGVPSRPTAELQTEPRITLPLRGFLDAPLRELNLWLGSEAMDSLPENLRGQCCAPLSELSAERLTELLHQAAQVRLQSKAIQLQARARQAGWEQALWEGLFRALGYKQNVWPMQRLAELRPRWQSEGRVRPLALQSRLLGISGLLPVELTRAQASADSYLRRIWDQWWREREEFGDCILPRELWRFHGQRPANHPQRRLALAAHWVAAGNLPATLERWCAGALSKGAFADSLLEILQVERDDFWSWHWTIRSTRLGKPQPLLGATRVTDLAVNVILPWFWARAVEGKNEAVQRLVENRYFAWPPAEDNALLRLARQRLLGGTSRRMLRGAAAQQGLLQIVRDFCDHSNAICENCQFPELVRNWKATD